MLRLASSHKVLHLGGDEVSVKCYNQSASVHKWLQQHPGVGVDDLIPMFWTRVHKIAAKHGAYGNAVFCRQAVF